MTFSAIHVTGGGIFGALADQVVSLLGDFLATTMQDTVLDAVVDAVALWEYPPS